MVVILDAISIFFSELQIKSNRMNGFNEFIGSKIYD